jgi:DNA topoisomerase III
MQYQIGTDASMATHVQNIISRNFARIDASGGKRLVVPTQLGITLVHGYFRVDPELVLPKVRAYIEHEISEIAKGLRRLTFRPLVRYVLDSFKKKFLFFVSKITAMDELFGASFRPLTETGRYMRLIMAKPTRYCEPFLSKTSCFFVFVSMRIQLMN